MRDVFVDSLVQLARRDRRIVLLCADYGAINLDRFRAELPDQCINVGIAEENMVGVAAGLAMSGKVAYCYTIIPFATTRCFEQVRIDVCCQNLPVKMIGVGAGVDYSTLGPTHHGLEDVALMRVLPDMTVLSPCDNTSACAFARLSLETPGPAYVRLDRSGIPLVYPPHQEDFSPGLTLLRTGQDLCIIATGKMVLTALTVAEELARRSVEAGVIDLYRVKPLDAELLLEMVGDSQQVVTLEEHSIIGGIGSAVAEVLAERGKTSTLRRIGLPDRFCRHYGSRDYLHHSLGLSVEAVVESLLQRVPR